jgi:hypothetical protein
MALGAARKPNSTPMQLTRLSLPRPHNQVNMPACHNLTNYAYGHCVFVLNRSLSKLQSMKCSYCFINRQSHTQNASLLCPTLPQTQALLLEVVQRMSECSPVSVVGDAIWGEESGVVHILQVKCIPRALRCHSC